MEGEGGDGPTSRRRQPPNLRRISATHTNNQGTSRLLPNAAPFVPRQAPENTTSFPHNPVQTTSWGMDPPPTVTSPSLARSQLSASPQVYVTTPPTQSRSITRRDMPGGKRIRVNIPSHADVGPSKQSPVASGSIDENSMKKTWSPSESFTSRPNIPTSSPTLTSRPTSLNIHKFFQAGPSSTSVNLGTASDSPPLPFSAYPPTPTHSTIAPTSRTIVHSDPPPPSQNLQNNFPVSQPGGDSGKPQSGISFAESRSPALQQTSQESEMGLDVGVETKPKPTPLMVPDGSLLTPALREALNTSITSGHLADTKIYLFSHRNSTGDICKPKALYANSVVLKSVPYFDDLFSGDYSESATRDLEEDVPVDDAVAEHYDYYSDSDLEDASEVLREMEDPDADDTSSFELRDTTLDPLASLPFSLKLIPSDDRTSAYYEEKVKKGRVIKVQDVAFITFQAFLLYLYTGRIDFAPFGSEENREIRTAEIYSLPPDRIPRPSPKSIYRLADKYDVPTLKLLAVNNIRERLGRCDPVRETFSKFSSYYPEILRINVEHLAAILTGADSGEVQSRVDESLQAFAVGAAHHASEAFSSLWKILTQGGRRKTTVGVRFYSLLGSPPPIKSSPLTAALIKSIRQGSFCDRRYLAKRKDKEDLRSPVYISSAAIEEIEESLNDLVVDSECGAYSSDYDSDSDYEDTAEGTGFDSENQSLKGKETKPTKTALLSTGAFLTWRALFFYLYTGQVRFAPLKSNGLEAREKYVRGNWGPGDPPSCSPKSACYLAGKLGLLHLENIALGDVTVKTSVTNIVAETFSKSTARLPRLREVQCQLLLSSSKYEQISKATEEHIHSLADGQVAHRYAALSLGFKLAIEAKRVVTPGAEALPYLPSTSTFPLGFENMTQQYKTKNKGRNKRAVEALRIGSLNTQIVAAGIASTPGPAFPPAIITSCPNPGCPRRNRSLSVRGVGGSTLCKGCGWRLW